MGRLHKRNKSEKVKPTYLLCSFPEEKSKAKRRLNQSTKEGTTRFSIERRNEWQLGKSRRWRSSCGGQELINLIMKTVRRRRNKNHSQREK